MRKNHYNYLRDLHSSVFICGLKTPCTIFLLLFLLIMANTAWAELKWKETSQTIQIHPLQAIAIVPFEFTNVGSESISILDLNPSCGCITGKVGKKTYASGETGTVVVTFNMQGRQGGQSKGLAVISDDSPTTPTHLYIHTTIPKTYVPAVKRVEWMPGEEHKSKSCRLVNSGKRSFPLDSAVPLRDGISVELKTVREGFEYDLIITPSADLKNTLIPITVYPAKLDGLESVRTYTVYALVR